MVGLGLSGGLRGFERRFWSATLYFILVSFFFFFFFSFALCPQMLKSIFIKDNLRCRPTPVVSFGATP